LLKDARQIPHKYKHGRGMHAAAFDTCTAQIVLPNQFCSRIRHCPGQPLAQVPCNRLLESDYRCKIENDEHSIYQIYTCSIYRYFHAFHCTSVSFFPNFLLSNTHLNLITIVAPIGGPGKVCHFFKFCPLWTDSNRDGHKCGMSLHIGDITSAASRAREVGAGTMGSYCGLP